MPHPAERRDLASADPHSRVTRGAQTREAERLEPTTPPPEDYPPELDLVTADVRAHALALARAPPHDSFAHLAHCRPSAGGGDAPHHPVTLPLEAELALARSPAPAFVSGGLLASGPVGTPVAHACMECGDECDPHAQLCHWCTHHGHPAPILQHAAPTE